MQETASLPGAVRVQCLAQGHLDTLLYLLSYRRPSCVLCGDCVCVFEFVCVCVWVGVFALTHMCHSVLTFEPMIHYFSPWQ